MAIGRLNRLHEKGVGTRVLSARTNCHEIIRRGSRTAADFIIRLGHALSTVIITGRITNFLLDKNHHDTHELLRTYN